MIQNNNNPVWNERFTLNVQEGHDNVYDEDICGKHTIGSGKVKLKHGIDGAKFNEWVQLTIYLDLCSR